MAPNRMRQVCILLAVLVAPIATGAATVSLKGGSRVMRSEQSLTNNTFLAATDATLRQRDVMCYNSPGKYIGNPNVYFCYDKGVGISVGWMYHGLTAACQNFADYPMGPGANVSQHWTFAEYCEEGVILLKLDFTGDPASCPDMVLSAALCENAFYVIADQCLFELPTSRGAWANDVCFTYTIDPNPTLNNPTIQLPTLG